MRLDNVFDTDDEATFLYSWFLKTRDKILSDNAIFFLHYHVTAALFIIACVVVTVGMFIMDPIDCIADVSVDEVIDNYCLYHSTYTISNGALGDTNEFLEPHPGISPTDGNTSGRQKYHNYYLWVALLLVIQGISFYIPRGLWKVWGDSKVHNILKEKDKAFNTDDEDANKSKAESEDELKEKNFRRLSTYILSKSHSAYYWKLLVCETLNLLNAFLQLMIMNLFLGLGLSKENLFYNEDIIQLLQEKQPFGRGAAIEQTFPKISSCTFHIYGPTGSVVNYQAICVLPINAINEKIYVSLYIWLLFLIVLSILAVLYRLLFLLPFVRNVYLKIHLRTEELETCSLKDVRKHLGVGNWQLLLQLTGNRNMDSWELTNVVKYLCKMCQTMDKINKTA